MALTRRPRLTAGHRSMFSANSCVIARGEGRHLNGRAGRATTGYGTGRQSHNRPQLPVA